MGIKERQERDREAVRRAILRRGARALRDRGLSQRLDSQIAENRIQSGGHLRLLPSKDDIFMRSRKKDSACCTQADDPGFDAQLAGVDPLERVRSIFWRLLRIQPSAAASISS
jgi:hypothetical protein